MIFSFVPFFNNFTKLYPTVSSFRRETELRKDPIVVSSTSGRHLKLYDLALLEIDLNWVDWVRAIKRPREPILWTICILPGLCPYLCGKLYCNIPLSSMFKIYDANIIYFHFCIAPTTTAALNRPGYSPEKTHILLWHIAVYPWTSCGQNLL